MNIFLLIAFFGIIITHAAKAHSVDSLTDTIPAAILLDNISATGVFAFDNGDQVVVLALDFDGLKVASFNSTDIAAAMSGAPYPIVTPSGNIETNVGFNHPHCIWSPDNATFYLADTLDFVVWKHDASSLDVLAGQVGVEGHSGDGGAATSATLYSPYAGYTSPSDETFIADFHGCTIRKVSSGVIATFYGSHRACETASPHLDHPSGIGSDGTYLYVAQRGSMVISILLSDPTTVATIIGTGTPGVSPDGVFYPTDPVYRPACFTYIGNYALMCEKTKVRMMQFGNTSYMGSLWFSGLNHPRAIALTNSFTVIADSASKKIYVTGGILP